MAKPTTKISHHTTDAIYVRGASLVDDLIGKLTFTEMMYFQLPCWSRSWSTASPPR